MRFYIISCLQKSLTITRDLKNDDDDGYDHNKRSDLPIPKSAACSDLPTFF